MAAPVCKSTAYHLYLINFHSKSLPCELLKTLVESLVFSQLTYALPVWGPAVYQNCLSRINRLHNRAICIVCGLYKSEHVSRCRQAIGWLSVLLLMRCHALCAMLDHYTSQDILVNPPIQIRCHHTHNTG